MATYWKTTSSEAADRLISSFPNAPNHRSHTEWAISHKPSSDYMLAWHTAADSDPGIMHQHLGQFQSDPRLSTAWLSAQQQWLRGSTRQDLIRYTNSAASRFGTIHKTWKTFAISPLEDLPGRVTGFAAHFDGAMDVMRCGAQQESLILGLSQLLTIDAKTLFVSPELTSVIRMQMDSYREIHRPAPLMGLLSAVQPNRGWRQLGRQLVFWGPHHTPALFREAIASGGKIYCGPMAPTHLTISSRLAQVERRSKAWPEALERHLLGLPTPAAIEFVTGLGMTPSELKVFLDDCEQSLRDRLLPVMKTEHQAVSYGGVTIVREGCEWRCPSDRSRNIRVSDIVMLITRIYDYAEKVYEGTLAFRGKTIRFRDKAKEIEADPEAWVRHQVWKKATGIPYIHPNWRKHVVQLAQLFGNPEYVANLPKMGWSPSLDGVVVHSWSVSRGGNITTCRHITRKARVGRIPQPLPVSAKTVDAISRTPGVGAFWGVAAQVAASLLHPLIGQRPADIVLVGREARAIGAIASRLCGCRTVVVTVKSESTKAHEAAQESVRHSWPLLVTADHENSSLASICDGHRTPTAIYRPKNDLRSVSIAIDRGADVIDLAGTLQQTADLETFGADVLPAYLESLAKRDFKLPTSGSPTMRVLRDMCDWWEELGGDFDLKGLYPDKSRWRQCLYRILSARAADVTILPRGFKDCQRGNKVVVEVDSQHVYLDPDTLSDVLVRRVPIDTKRLAEGLSTAGELQGIVDGLWVLPIALWNDVSAVRHHRSYVA